MPITDYYVTTDAMGSVMAVLDEAGNVLERRSYDAFGEASYMLPDGTVVPDSPTGVDIGFQGQLMDELTGMYQMGFRWYSPALGRWVSRDPIGLEGGVNLATFVSNLPNLVTDYLGMMGELKYYDSSGNLVSLKFNSAMELQLIVVRCRPDSIDSITFGGHASGGAQTIDSGDKGTEQVELDSNDRPILAGVSLGKDAKNHRITIDLENLLKSRLTFGARIILSGCCAGKDEAQLTTSNKMLFGLNKSSIAREVSRALPEALVMASTESTKGAEDAVLNDFVNGGIRVFYKGETPYQSIDPNSSSATPRNSKR